MRQTRGTIDAPTVADLGLNGEVDYGVSQAPTPGGTCDGDQARAPRQVP